MVAPSRKDLNAYKHKLDVIELSARLAKERLEDVLLDQASRERIDLIYEQMQYVK